MTDRDELLKRLAEALREQVRTIEDYRNAVRKHGSTSSIAYKAWNKVVRSTEHSNSILTEHDTQGEEEQ